MSLFSHKYPEKGRYSAFGLLVFSCLVMAATASTPIYGPMVIDQPGTYVLMNDIVDYHGSVVYNGTEYWEPPFKILASDVVLDGNGHSITGVVNTTRSQWYLSNDWVPDQDCVMVNPGLERVHVKNLRVLGGFDVAIDYYPTVDGLIENNEIRGNLYGIYTLSTNNVDIRGNIIEGNNYDGILCPGYFNGQIENNIVNSNNERGIHLLNAYNNLIRENTANNNRIDGISLEAGSNNIFELNTANNNGINGILSEIGYNNTFERNTANQNALNGFNLTWIAHSKVNTNTADTNGNNGIFILECGNYPSEGIVVADNHAWSNAWDGINLTHSSYHTVSGNSVEQNSKAGISLNDFDLSPQGYDTTSNTIVNNTADHNGVYGIVSRGASGNTYRGNTVRFNPTGIDIGEVFLTSAFLLSDGNELVENIVKNNALAGISVHGYDYARITSQNVLDGNTVCDNDQIGVKLDYANANTLKNNCIAGNGNVGVLIKDSQDNNIYNNCFNNTENRAFGGMIHYNTWNVLKQPGPNIVGGKYLGGNYWAQPDGQGHSQKFGHNEDEFIVNYYTVNGDTNIDYFPLWNALNASFTTNPSPPSGTVPLTVTFTDTSAGYPTCWVWDFGDGFTSNESNPTHTFTSDGSYTVTLTASRCIAQPCAGTSSMSTVVTVGPRADFTATPTVGTAPLIVSFTDTSTVSGTSYSWSFPGGTPGTSTERNPVVRYDIPGTYSVSLTVTGSFGTKTEVKNNYIEVRPSLVPVADFSASPLTGQRPLTVQFTDLSTNNPTSWYWTFGDGSYSTLQNPSHTYAEPGTYTVSLTASNSGGSSTPAVKTDYITVAGPVADFTASPRTGIKPLTVYFTDLSTGNPTEWAWDFNNDGVTDSYAKNPTWTYPGDGTYTVKLTVDYSKAWADHETKTGYITVSQVPAPEADFTGAPRTGIKPLRVDFTDLSTNNPTSWSWDFGDGSTSTEKNPSHTYQAPGTYTVRLTASNEGGANSNTKNAYITVDNLPGPVADFSASPRSGTRPLTVDFTDLSTGNPTGWEWDFNNDGTVDSMDQHPSWTYDAVGTYAVKLKVTNEGGSDTVIKTGYITVSNIPSPVSEFTASPRSGTMPLTVNFIDQSTGNPVSWSWDFGDGSTSTERNPSHTYQTPGTYTVRLNVTNNGGYNVNTKPAYIVVTDIALPTANFVASPLTGITPLTVQFTDTSTGGPTTWLWDFGDGTTSTLQSPTHTFTSPRKYTVSLTVSNAKGVNAKIEPDYIYVRNTPPVAWFNATPTQGYAPLTVQFTDLSSGQGISSWNWDFGDGGTSTTQSPAYIYNVPGNYTVRLTVANDGGSNVATRTQYISVLPAPPAPPANVISLYPGWNFVSTPRKLADGHKTAQQVFGGVNMGGRAILLYDGSTGMWKQLRATDEVLPLDGLWIYSVGRMDVTLQFDTSSIPVPPQKQLYTGWNAIGISGVNQMSARDSLISIGSNWNMVIGYRNGATPEDPIIRGSTDPRYSDTRMMYPTHGYWISMNANALYQGVL
ncbi:MAG TPA: PKD domain-containing protein [Methanolinea sp.]|nr:PKD domain-containing protein [Methanolinea sp.]